MARGVSSGLVKMKNTVDGLQILAPDALPILAELDSRDASLWLMPSFAEVAGPEATARVLGLPWELVLSETASDGLLKSVDALDSAIESPLVRRRGLVHVIDVPPSNTVLPPRSLPIFLLNGRNEADNAGFAAIVAFSTLRHSERRHGRRRIERFVHEVDFSGSRSTNTSHGK